MLPISKFAAAPRLPELSRSPEAPVLPSPAKTLFPDVFERGPLRLTQGETEEVGGGAAKSKTEQAIEHMWRDNDPPLSESEQKRVKAGFKTLTEAEILQLDQSGMRIWRDNQLPKVLTDKGITIKPIGTRAAYVRGAKVLLLNPNGRRATANDLRHELGHARDDLGDEKKATKPLESLSKKEAMKQFEKNAGSMSRSKTVWETQAPKDGKYGSERVAAKVTIEQAYETFMKRTKDLPGRQLFNSGDAVDGYARDNLDEFFGEAWGAYYGGDAKQQARLLTFSPEMFFILEADAKARGKPTVDAKSLESVNIFDAG